MNWDDLRVFLAVARARRLGEAARLTGLDATTVGRRIARLEAALETTLFETSPAGHTLTTEGERLLLHAEGCEQAALSAHGDARGERTRLSGSVRVSASEGFGARVIAPHLASFSGQHPGIEVDLIASTGFLNPSRREADLAIMLARPKSGPLLVRKLTDYRLGLYAAADHPAVCEGVNDIAAIARHRLTGYVPDLIYSPELRYLDEIGLAPTLRSTSINAQAALIAGGAGIGILPCFIGAVNPGLVRLLTHAVDIRRSFWLVVHRDVRRIARVDSFVVWLEALVARLQPLLLGNGTQQKHS